MNVQNVFVGIVFIFSLLMLAFSILGTLFGGLTVNPETSDGPRQIMVAFWIGVIGVVGSIIWFAQ